MKIFIAQNGREVAKVITPSGVTGYIDTAIKLETLQALRAKLVASLNNPDTPEEEEEEE